MRRSLRWFLTSVNALKSTFEQIHARRMLMVADHHQLILTKCDDGEIWPSQRQSNDSKINRIVETRTITFVGAAVLYVNLDLWMRLFAVLTF